MITVDLTNIQSQNVQSNTQNNQINLNNTFLNILTNFISPTNQNDVDDTILENEILMENIEILEENDSIENLCEEKNNISPPKKIYTNEKTSKSKDKINVDDLTNIVFIPQNKSALHIFEQTHKQNQSDNISIIENDVSTLLEKLNGKIVIEHNEINSNGNPTVQFDAVANKLELINQITKYIDTHYREFSIGSKVEIQLNPISLGKMKIEVMKQDDVLTIKFSVENKEVEKMLNEEINRLETSLKNISFKDQEIRVLITYESNEQHNNQKQEDKKKKTIERQRRYKSKGVQKR